MGYAAGAHHAMGVPTAIQCYTIEINEYGTLLLDGVTCFHYRGGPIEVSEADKTGRTTAR